MRKLQMTFPRTQACVWPGQDKILSCHNPSDTLLIGRELENTENRWQCPGPGSHFLYSPLPKPHVSPHITGEGESGFFPDMKYMISPPTPSNSQHPTCQSPLTSDTICEVRANATGWCREMALTSDASHALLSYHVSDQVTETLNFHNSTSVLKNSIKPATKLRKTLNHCSQSNSETVKWRRSLWHRRNGVGQSVCVLLSRAPSPHNHFLPPHKLTEPIFMALYEVPVNSHMCWIVSQWWLTSGSVPSSLPIGEENSNL